VASKQTSERRTDRTLSGRRGVADITATLSIPDLLLEGLLSVNTPPRPGCLSAIRRQHVSTFDPLDDCESSVAQSAGKL